MFNKAMVLTGGNGVDLITFYDECMSNGVTPAIRAPRGMTWEEFINSKYVPMIDADTDYPGHEYRTYVMEGDYVSRKRIFPDFEVTDFYMDVTLSDFTRVRGTDLIIEGYTYTYEPCYLRGTLITLADGSTKVVEEISYEDGLLVWDFDNSCFTSAKPLWIKQAQTTKRYYRFKFADGTEIGLVGQNGKCHRLFNVEKQEFISGTDFHIGEHTFNDKGEVVKLIGIEIVEQEVEFYNIVTDFHMNCFANGLLTSTQYNNVYPIKDMKFVKDNREVVPFESFKGIPKKFYDGMRLGEQNQAVRSVEKSNTYIARMLCLMVGGVN